MSCGNCSGARSAPTLSLSISTTTNRITNTGFSYDAAGNVLTDGFSSYIWNAEGRMDSTAGYRYVYDGDGRRVAKVTGGHGRGSTGRNPSQQTHNSNEKLYWYGLGGQVLAESDLSGTIISEYIYFSGQRIARRTPSGTVHYYLSDRLGSARVM
ncbi:MAG: hypothetical protein HY313_10485, partial [Acidobacteria bacterium]|nr:hypothetical protein [Acidobacteriota bacterium]